MTLAALDFTIGSGSYKNTHNSGVVVDDRQHKRGESVLCGVIEVRSPVSKYSNHCGVAAIRSVHKCGLSMLV